MTPAVQPHPPACDRDAFLDTADRIGARLCRDAIWAGDRCNWMGDSMEFVTGAWKVAHRSFGPELYNGTSGIALFLGRLFEFTGEERHRAAARGALRQALSAASGISNTARIGFYCGHTGIAYALIAVGRILDDELVDRGIDLMRSVCREDPSEQALDVIAGSAGAIPVMLWMSEALGHSLLLECAIRHGDHLMKAARRTTVGWSWNTLNIEADRRQQDLTGFSHGAAGIGWALLELHHATGEPAYREGAEQAFRYERQWFDTARENWPDFRSLYDLWADRSRIPGYPVTWCHGAPGIALSRLRAYALTGDSDCLREAEAATRTTMATVEPPAGGSDEPMNFCLCHGAAGNAEVLLCAGQLLNRPEYVDVCARLGAYGIARYEKEHAPWPCGVTDGGESPDLMLGLAGIGYFYLRLFDPKRTPSVLLFTG